MPRKPADPNAPKKPRTVKTAADLQAELEKAKEAENKASQRRAELEARAAESKLAEDVIKITCGKVAKLAGGDPNLNFFQFFFDGLKKRYPNLSEAALGTTILKACGIPRVVVTQKPIVPRKKKDA